MFVQISASNVTYIFILCRSERMNNMFWHFDNSFGNYNYTRQRHICVIEDLAFSIIIYPIIGFPSEQIAVTYLYNFMSNCANLSPFNVCCLIRYLTLPLHAINDHNWSFHFFKSLTIGDSMFYKAITSLWLSLNESLLIIYSFWEIQVMCFLLPAVPYLLVSGSSEAITSLWLSLNESLLIIYSFWEIQVTCFLLPAVPYLLISESSEATILNGLNKFQITHDTVTESARKWKLQTRELLALRLLSASSKL